MKNSSKLSMFGRNILLSIFFFNLLSTTFSIYIPESNEDWTKLKPKSRPLAGSYNSFPFRFGVVVKPYNLNNEVVYKESESKSCTRSITDTPTAVVASVPKATKTADVVIQIQDGQIQRQKPATYVEVLPIDLYGSDEEVEKEANDSNKGEDKEDWDEKEVDKDTMVQKRKLGDEGEDIELSGNGFDDGVKVFESEASDDVCIDDECSDEDFKGEVFVDECDKESTEGGFDKGKENGRFISQINTVSCVANTTLSMTLKDSILRDASNRIGSIVSGRQFQFDGPVPQYGTVYASGWSITDGGQLALGNSTKFYQCASGDFFNIYDQPIAYQCNPVSLDVVELIEC